jgi:hypothetical protein
MRFRASSWLAWSLAGLSLTMFVAGVALTFLSLSGAPDTRPSSTWGTVGGLLVFVPFLAFPLVGALIASKRPHNPIGWICLTTGLFWMLIFSVPAGSGPYPVTLDALVQVSWVPPVGLLGIYMILLFPDGKLPSRRWRPFAWFSGAVMVLICISFALVPGTLEDHPGVRNPFGLESYPWLEIVANFAVVLLPLCILTSAFSLLLRYRRSGGEVREQIKWLAFAASFVGVVYFGGLITQLLFAPDPLTPEGTTPLWASLEQNLLLLSYAGIPVAIGIAILRYRLYDIDLIINRTLVYGSLTISLAVVYLGGVVVLQRLFTPFMGESNGLATVASTLAIAALFNPLRRRLQSFTDRRFYRRKYDATKTLEAFGSRLREETDLDALSNDVVGVVSTTMQPAHVSLWLRPDPEPKARSAALRQYGHDEE